jgi:bacterial/archaeal transporter family protein
VWNREHRWLVHSMLTVLLWGAWGVVSKLIVDRTSPFTSQVLFTFGLVAPLAVALASRRRFEGTARLRGFNYAVLTGLLGGLGNLAMYAALVDGKASTIVTLTSLAPLVTVLLAAVALHERIGRRQVIGLALALIAIWLLSV